MRHLTLRVAWHDAAWDGSICRAPSGNPYCLELDRIRGERDDEAEDSLAGSSFSMLTQDQLPPCKAESGAFMNKAAWLRTFRYPYADLPKAASTHGKLRPTTVTVPPFSTFAVPFAWMLREHGDDIEARSPMPLAPDLEPPFRSSWVFDATRQRQLLDACFGPITPGSSLALFYTKSGHPLGDGIERLVVGFGRVSAISPILEYETADASTYPLWDRLISHTIRPNGTDGFLVPYHAYLATTGDQGEDARRHALLDEIAVIPDRTHSLDYSYGSQVVAPDVALAVLEQALVSVRAIIRHGIVEGPWAEQEEWLNSRIAEAWNDRGAFPGAGAVLEALGLRLGTALVMELQRSGTLSPRDDPWPLLDAMLRGGAAPPTAAYAADLAAVGPTWAALPQPRRDLVMLLSPFALTSRAAVRWLEPAKRASGTRAVPSDLDLLANPYRLAELDLGSGDDPPVSMATIDRGLLPDPTIASAHPISPPTRVDSPADPRRLRAALVTVLRDAADDGDALLTVDDAATRAAELSLSHPLLVPTDWIGGHIDPDNAELRVVDAPVIGAETLAGSARPRCLQLADLADRGAWLAKILSARAAKKVPSLEENWRDLLVEAIKAGGGVVEETLPIPVLAPHTPAPPPRRGSRQLREQCQPRFVEGDHQAAVEESVAAFAGESRIRTGTRGRRRRVGSRPVVVGGARRTAGRRSNAGRR
jgi:hypothetical protein